MVRPFVDRYLDEVAEIVRTIDRDALTALVSGLAAVRARKGRLFMLGIGGSAANASHAVNDFRKIGGIETYAPTDNVAELTARTNDDGFETVFVRWLETSRLNADDAVFVLSVGGGSSTTSRNLVLAMEHARKVGAKVLSVVSRDGGAARGLSDVCVLVPVVEPTRITPHAEEWHAVVGHLVVNALCLPEAGGGAP
jgi:D-sedoheptulose 7-phosphate isomerase